LSEKTTILEDPFQRIWDEAVRNPGNTKIRSMEDAWLKAAKMANSSVRLCPHYRRIKKSPCCTVMSDTNLALADIELFERLDLIGIESFERLAKHCPWKRKEQDSESRWIMCPFIWACETAENLKETLETLLTTPLKYRIMELLHERGTMTTDQIAAATGASYNRVLKVLNELR